MIDKTLIERLTRQELAKLSPHETLSTAELGNRICDGMGTPAHERQFRSAVFAHLDKLGAHARELCELIPTEAVKGFNRGRTINRRVWHHIESAAMPDRPHTQSSGAASQGASIISRIDAIEAWIAARDPLYRVL